jgi:hypothetical protein
MDKIKNSALYKKAENMVGAEDGHQGAAHQTGGHHVPGHTGAAVQQGGNYPSTTGTHQVDPSYAGGVGSGAYSSEQHGTALGGTHTTVYPAEQHHTGQHHTGYGVGAGVGEQRSHVGGAKHEGGALAGMKQQAAHLTGADRPTTSYATGAQPTHHGSVVGGLKEKVANVTGSNQHLPHNAPTEYGTGVAGVGVGDDHHHGTYTTGAQPAHQAGVIGGLKEKVGNMTGSNQHAAHNTPTEFESGVGGVGVGSDRHHPGHLAGVHDQAGYNTHNAYGASHATVSGQKPSIADRAKGLLNKAKP